MNTYLAGWANTDKIVVQAASFSVEGDRLIFYDEDGNEVRNVSSIFLNYVYKKEWSCS